MSKKKTIKRIPAFLLCMALILCMLPMTALAHQTSGPTFDGTSNGSLTINKTDGAGIPVADTSLEYTIYKVATVQQTNTAGVVSTQYLLDAGVTMDSGAITSGSPVPSGATSSRFDTASLPAGTALTNSGGTGTLVFSGLPLGLYLVRETVTPAGVSVSNDFLVSIPMSTVVGGNNVWDYDPVATPKNTVINGSVTKTVTSGATNVSGNTWTASLGNTITYQISATLPTTFTVTPFTTYKITDIPASALIIDKDGSGAPGSFNGIVVTVGGTTLINGIDYNITDSGTGFVIELITDVPASTTPGTQSAALTDGAVVTVTYDATLSPSALGGGSFTNNVQVDSQYNTPGGPVTPPPITPPPINPPPTIITYNYALRKVDDSATPAALAGAEFAIKDSSNNYLAWTAGGGWSTATGLSDPNLYTVTSATGATNGIVSFNGLAGGSYSLEEINAPSGYSALTAPIAVTIDATSTADADILGGGIGYSIQVVNSLANTFTLPGTGGMGIYFYTIGGVLVIALAIVLFSRNRKRRSNNV